MPISAVWAGESVNPSALMPPNSPPLVQAATSGGTPFRLNLHYHDVGHSLLVGPTGSGKSVAICLFAANGSGIRMPRSSLSTKGIRSTPYAKRRAADSMTSAKAACHFSRYGISKIQRSSLGVPNGLRRSCVCRTYGLARRNAKRFIGRFANSLKLLAQADPHGTRSQPSGRKSEGRPPALCDRWSIGADA